MQYGILLLDIAYLPLVVFFYPFHLAIVRLILQCFTQSMARRRNAVVSPTQASIMTILASFSFALSSQHSLVLFKRSLNNLHQSEDLALAKRPSIRKPLEIDET